MILWQMRMLNGKPIFDGRMIKVRRSDKNARLYQKVRERRHEAGRS
jgi:hypothetical protein